MVYRGQAASVLVASAHLDPRSGPIPFRLYREQRDLVRSALDQVGTAIRAAHARGPTRPQGHCLARAAECDDDNELMAYRPE